MLVYSSNDELQWWEEYEYDADGNEIKLTDRHVDGSLMLYCVRVYDADGLPLSFSSYDENGAFSYRYEYQYDSNGNRSKSLYYGVDGTLEEWTEFEYAYVS